MSKSDIIKTIENMLKAILVVKNKNSIKPEDRLVDDLGIDSIGSVEFVTNLEDEYSIEISDEEMESAKTIEQVVDIVLGKINIAA